MFGSTHGVFEEKAHALMIKEGSHEAEIGSIAEEELRELVTGSLRGGPNKLWGRVNLSADRIAV